MGGGGGEVGIPSTRLCDVLKIEKSSVKGGGEEQGKGGGGGGLP